jgi:hypothetical protein
MDGIVGDFSTLRSIWWLLEAAIYIDPAPRGAAALEPGVYTHVHRLEAQRSGAMSVIRLDDLEGLITFPSFHTTNAILFAWALWPIRYVRIGGLALNLLMIASTPTTESHYSSTLSEAQWLPFWRLPRRMAADERSPRRKPSSRSASQAWQINRYGYSVEPLSPDNFIMPAVPASARNRVFPRLGLVWDVPVNAMLKSIKVLVHA